MSQCCRTCRLFVEKVPHYGGIYVFGHCAWIAKEPMPDSINSLPMYGHEGTVCPCHAPKGER